GRQPAPKGPRSFTPGLLRTFSRSHNTAPRLTDRVGTCRCMEVRRNLFWKASLLMRASVPLNLFETLESRTLFAAAVLSHGVLRVVGDGAAANTIVVANSSDGASVDVAINWTTARGVAKNVIKSFPKTLGITQIRVRGGRMGDLISVGQANGSLGIAALDLPARVLGLAGNDVITTAGGNDVIFAGAGNDMVGAGAGLDWLRGMAGDDALDGGGDNDRLNGGFGNDALGGGGGDDLLRGEAGNDLLDGGGGNDAMFGGVGNDTLTGASGDDTLWGGFGDDSLNGGSGNDSVGGVLGTNSLTGGNGPDTFHVRALAFNPTNDYDASEDTLDIVRRASEVAPPAA